MSCHFHMLRRRRAAEAAQRAREAALAAEAAAVEEKVNAKPESVKKASKGRGKGEA